MMPNLGQGGCQAIEDAYVLAEILSETKTTDKIEDALQDFYKKRIVRVTIIQAMSKLASDLIVNAFDTPWSPHDNLGQSWKSYLTFAWKPLLQYVIFPAQFAYLYSYYPSGRIEETSKALEESWKTKHFEGAEAAFAAADAGYVREAAPSFFQKAETSDVETPESVMSGSN
jgi:zeaxanthin epoxidase